MTDWTAQLRQLQPSHEFFIGVDSDGCAFDNMEIKQKECFCPQFIRHWNLQPVSRYAREVWEWVNLYSIHRGTNRFVALVTALRYLRERKEVKARGFDVVEPVSLEKWVMNESKLGNAALKKKVDETGDEYLATALAWSEAINRQVDEIARNIGPFAGVKPALSKAAGSADVMVVSQASVATIQREWHEHGIAPFARTIGGQEMGSKGEQIKLASNGRYEPARILMIGDAPGDRVAAQENGAAFYPIIPGREEESWQQLCEEALDRFFAGTYGGAYEEALAQAFASGLPETPHWSK